MKSTATTLVALALCAAATLDSAHAIYEDQAGLLDWKTEHLGRVSAVAFGGGDKRGHASVVRGTSRAVYVATDARSRAVARLDAKSGAIKWRHVFHEGDSIDTIQLTNYGLLTISSTGKHLRLWDAADGTLVWDNFAYAGAATGAFVAAHAISDDHVVVLSTTGAALVHLKDGTVAWRSAFALDTAPSSSQLASTGTTLFALAASELLSIDVATGAVQTKTLDVGAGAAALRTTDATGAVVAVAVEADSITIEPVEQSGSSRTTTTRIQALGLSTDAVAIDASVSTSLVLELARGAKAFIAIDDALTASLVHEIQAGGVVVASQTDDNTLFHVDATSSGANVASVSLLPDTSRTHWHSMFDGSAFGGSVQQAFVGCPTRQRDNEAPRCRALLVMEDDGLVFSANEDAVDEDASNVLWTREEALANIQSVQWVTPAETAIEKQPLTKIPSFYEEIGLEVARAKQLATTLLALSTSLFDATSLSSEPRARVASPNAHFFGFSKYVVALTESGKLFAIRAELATIAWSTFVGRDYKLFVTRDHPALGMGPELLLVSQASHLLWIDGDSGKQIESVHANADAKAPSSSWVVMLPKRAHHMDDTDASVRRSVALVDATTLRVSLFPTATADFAHPELHNFYFYRYDATANALRGFVVETDDGDDSNTTPTYKATEVWTVVLPRGHALASLTSQKEHTVIDSSVTITGDDSLLLKYLNPNLFSVATLGLERLDGEKADVSVLHVTLLDSVAGRVIHRGRHLHATGPVRMVQSENWLVYSFWNAKDKRTELVSLALYDGAVGANNLHPWKRPTWTETRSSFDPRAPFVLQKSFIFPTTIASLGVTVTSRGITPQFVLVGMGTGQLFKLARNFIDPRQPDKPPSVEEQTEGLMQYAPLVSVYNRQHAMISYNQTVANLATIATASAELESTTLVFAYGLDHFYVRLAPANAFDVLPSDFNYEMLILLCIGFVAATLLSRGLAQRKALNEAWK